MVISDAETLYCHPESCAEHVSLLIQDRYIYILKIPDLTARPNGVAGAGRQGRY